MSIPVSSVALSSVSEALFPNDRPTSTLYSDIGTGNSLSGHTLTPGSIQAVTSATVLELNFLSTQQAYAVLVGTRTGDSRPSVNFLNIASGRFSSQRLLLTANKQYTGVRIAVSGSNQVIRLLNNTDNRIEHWQGPNTATNVSQYAENTSGRINLGSGDYSDFTQIRTHDYIIDNSGSTKRLYAIDLSGTRQSFTDLGTDDFDCLATDQVNSKIIAVNQRTKIAQAYELFNLSDFAPERDSNNDFYIGGGDIVGCATFTDQFRFFDATVGREYVFSIRAE